MFYDPTMLLLIPALLLVLFAQARVKSVYAKYAKVPTQAGLPASDVVMRILRENGNEDVRLARVSGTLTDNFDPRSQTMNLSDEVFGSSSIAAVGVAAHEAGHAMQKKEGYAPLALRSVVVPAVGFGSALSLPIFIFGLILSWQPLIIAGIVLYSLTVLFSLITLPVEFNASSRAIAMLRKSGIIQNAQDEKGIKAVLNAAAFTYVASAIGALLQLARLILLSRGSSRRRS